MLKLKFLHVVEVEHLSYPCVNLWINYAYIKSEQINRTRTAKCPKSREYNNFWVELIYFYFGVFFYVAFLYKTCVIDIDPLVN
jgi:hypothetical protein